jgi:hypothetical protein
VCDFAPSDVHRLHPRALSLLAVVIFIGASLFPAHCATRPVVAPLFFALDLALLPRCALVPIKHGTVAVDPFTRVLSPFWPHAATVRSVSISLSQEIIWFQLGMLWDAKILSIFAISTDIKQMKRFLMDLSVDGCVHSANLSLVESCVCCSERRHVTAVLRREHDSLICSR